MENKIQGMNVKAGNVDFVKARLGINKESFTKWLASQSGEWINIDILQSKAGELYPKLNEYKKPSPSTDYDKPF